MAETSSNNRISIKQLILIPSVITLAVTLIRLVGELQHWSTTLFNSEPGGPGSIIGITWLAPIFGIYFALKLYKAGDGPMQVGRTIGYAVLGFVLMFVGGFVGFSPQFQFPGQAVVGLLIIAAAGAIPFPSWPALFKTLLAYGFAARIPVAILMFFAIRGQWGTHYDVLPPGFPPETGFWSTYLQIAFLPQLVLWVVFTIITGALCGGIATAIVHRRKPTAEAANAA